MRPPEAEFSHETKEKAKERAGYKCERCGKTGHLEIHHILPLWWAKEVPALSYAVISHLANTMVLCVSCHRKTHLEETRTAIAEKAPEVLRKYLEVTIQPQKDDWRKKLQKLRA